MTQHPKGAELVDAYEAAVAAYIIAPLRKSGGGQSHADAVNAARNAIIALIDDPVRAAGPELLEALRRISSGRSSVTECATIARAAIAKAEAPADAEGGER